LLTHYQSPNQTNKTPKKERKEYEIIQLPGARKSDESDTSKVEENRLMVGQKTGGRTAGTPNKVTSELRKTLKGIVAAELDELPQTLSELPARERLELLIKLMPFCLPKVNTIGGTYDRDWASVGED
jgi:hypothetical protein